ncbi:MAG: hypothetical protein ACPL5I_05330 [Thermodesulfobacteriota bacterium]
MSKRGSVNIILILFLFLLFFCPFSSSPNSKQKAGKYIAKIRTIDVVRVKFGSGPDQIKVTTPSEANPEGPMSFALGTNGEIYILDQLNSRIQVFKDGKRIRTIPIKEKEAIDFKDIDFIQENKIVLLKRFYVAGCEKTSLYVIDATGNILNTIPLEGKLISDSGLVTEILVIRKGKFAGIWVIVDNRSVRIASLDGTASERISVPGKLSLNGRRIFNMKKIGDITAVIYRSQEDSLAHWDPECIVHFDMAIVHLLGVWDDQKSRIFLGAFLENGDEKGKRKYANEVVVLSPELREMGRIKLLVQKVPHEIWRYIRVSPHGHIYQMFVDKQEVVVRKYEF